MSLNRKRRRAQYATPSRSKPYKKYKSSVRGYEKIMRFIAHGIKLNRKHIDIKVNPVAKAVREGILDRLGL